MLKVRQLKLHLDEERQKEIINGGSESSQHETKIPEMQLLEIQRKWLQRILQRVLNIFFFEVFSLCPTPFFNNVWENFCIMFIHVKCY